MTRSSRYGARGLLAALALIVGASAFVVAPAVAAERHDARGGRDRGHWHGRPAYGYGAPTYVQAPPPVVYAPPAPGGINLLLNFR